MTQSQSYTVTDPSQVSEVRRAANRLAIGLGFDEVGAGKVALVATELATNLAKHATRGGQILMQPLNRHTCLGIDLISIDSGPGMANAEDCERDGFSSGSSPGTGLGSIRRQSSSLDIYTRGGAGTVLRATLWAGGAPTPIFGPACCDFGAVSVAVAGEEVCGDGWEVNMEAERATVLVVDGLGHGQGAYDASRTAREAFRQRPNLGPTAMIEHLHEALRASRGAALAVVELRPFRDTLVYAGIGNISAAILGDETPSRSLVSMSGIVGQQIRRVQEFTYPWTPSSTLVMHSDGIGSHWNMERLPGLLQRSPGVIAAAVYRDNVRSRDDATVLVLKDRRMKGR